MKLIINFICFDVQRSWAHAQVRRAYPEFVSELDMLTPEDVIWEPYTPEAVARHALLGLSPHCSANAGMWLTTAVLVYDIAVEAHCPHRVMRQFGQRQEFPVATALDRVERHNHR